MALISIPKDMPPILIDKSLDSEKWLKIVYLKNKGYTHEETLKLLERIAVTKILDITTIPAKNQKLSTELGQRKRVT